MIYWETWIGDYSLWLNSIFDWGKHANITETHQLAKIRSNRVNKYILVSPSAQIIICIWQREILTTLWNSGGQTANVSDACYNDYR